MATLQELGSALAECRGLIAVTTDDPERLEALKECAARLERMQLEEQSKAEVHRLLQELLKKPADALAEFRALQIRSVQR